MTALPAPPATASRDGEANKARGARTVLLLFAGNLSDRIGAKRALGGGTALFLLASTRLRASAAATTSLQSTTRRCSGWLPHSMTSDPPSDQHGPQGQPQLSVACDRTTQQTTHGASSATSTISTGVGSSEVRLVLGRGFTWPGFGFLGASAGSSES